MTSVRVMSDEPRELVFSEHDPLPLEGPTCPDCDSPLVDGECDYCTPSDDDELDAAESCSWCHGTGEVAFGHRCYHGVPRLHMSRPYRRVDPDAI